MTTQEVIEWYIRRQRERGQLQPGKLAATMGVQPQMVTMIIGGKRRFPMGRLDGAAAFFGISPDELIQTAHAAYAAEETHRAPAPPGATDGVPFPTPQPDRRKTDLGPPPGQRERRQEPRRHEA